MLQRYFLTLLLLSTLYISAHCGLRFHDQDMLKQHHNEPYPQNGPALTVHLIPHSHDDVGWLKTVDNYFYGGDMRTQFAGVQYTIDTVVAELVEHPQYKFSIVEVAFLYRWWNNATPKQREQMKTLVANKQIEFINAGWCMSDEANMYYEDFIDQMTVGLRWIKQIFNVVPQIAWHIDPFGHHSASASLFSQMGYQAFFFSRIDYQDKQFRLQQKSMEMVWRPIQLTGDKSTFMFTHVNYYHYSPPPGFCFDDVCRDEPIKDDPTLQDFNIDTRSDQFVNYFKSMANHYRTTNLLHTLGEDFQYTNSRMWYKNIDKLIKYINAKSQYGVTIKYSTPTDYIEAIRKQGATYPTKTDDFFPYADNAHSFWTGYFTSRVALKGFVKDFSRYAQTVRKHISQLKISDTNAVVRNSSKQIQQTIFGMEMALGILQHHDAVAGTAKQKVTDDYIATSLRSIEKFNDLYKQIKAEQVKVELGETVKPTDVYFNLFWNETGDQTGISAQLKAGKSILISFYNPSSGGLYNLRLKVPAQELNIYSIANTLIPGDVACANTKDANDCDLVFSLGFAESSNSYVKIEPVSSGGSAKLQAAKQLTITQQIKQFNLGSSDKLKITRGNQNFDLTINGATETFNIFYNYYQGFVGGQSSGAYIFRPLFDTSSQYSSIKKIYYVDGLTVGIVVLEGDKTVTKVFFYKTQNYVRNFGFMIETYIDSIPIDDKVGKQVTLNLKTKINNGKKFYTDTMGLEEQERVLDFRPTWNYTVNQPTAGNYYPINSFIRIQDSTTPKRTVTVLNDRSQGGAVLRPGEIQIMIHRRLLADDGRGVEQPLNETDADKKGLRQVVRHYVVFGNEYRAVQKMTDQRILPTLINSSSSNFGSAAIRSAPIVVPSTVKLYLRPFDDGSYLLRLHNMHPNQPTSVSLNDIWKVSEQTLAANQLRADWKKKQYTWNEQKSGKIEEKPLIQTVTQLWNDISEGKRGLLNVDGQTSIQLLPFEMKAFKISK